MGHLANTNNAYKLISAFKSAEQKFYNPLI